MGFSQPERTGENNVRASEERDCEEKVRKSKSSQGKTEKFRKNQHSTKN